MKRVVAALTTGAIATANFLGCSSRTEIVKTMPVVVHSPDSTTVVIPEQSPPLVEMIEECLKEHSS
jgi:hypothetical protein